MNNYKDDMVLYFNFVLDNKATMFTRKHYTLINLFEEQGGLIKQFALIAILLMKPFVFKRHDFKVFDDITTTHEYTDPEFLKKLKKHILPVEFYIFISDVWR